MKSLVLLSLTAVGVMGSWVSPSWDSGDARLEALLTGAALLMLATALRHVAESGRAK